MPLSNVTVGLIADLCRLWSQLVKIQYSCCSAYFRAELVKCLVQPDLIYVGYTIYVKFNKY